MTNLVQIVEECPLPPELESAWLQELPAARRAVLLNWPETRARHRSLLGSRLLREGLRRLGFPTATLGGLRYSRHGRPSLDLPIDFSLSHCAGRVLCALSTAGPVGVDVEPVGALTAEEFRNYLSAEERVWAGDDARRFCELWTRKEAVVKAAGTLGLAAMRDVRIDRDQVTHAGKHWHTAPIPVDHTFAAHVAQAGPFRSAPDLHRFTLDQLAHA